MIYSKIIRDNRVHFVNSDDVRPDDVVLCQGDMIPDLVRIGDLIGSEGCEIVVQGVNVDEEGMKTFYGKRLANPTAILECDVDVIMTPTKDGFDVVWQDKRY